MTKLTQQLRVEHQVLVARLDEVRNSIDPTTGKLPLDKAVQALIMIKKVLLAHLGKEDEQLYPVLERAAVTDPRTRDLLSRFGEDMAMISTAALKFFDKYNNAGLFNTSFPSELEGLYNVLARRIGAEESELYPAYDRAYEKYGDVVAATAVAVAPTAGPAADFKMRMGPETDATTMLTFAAAIVGVIGLMALVVWKFGS